MEGLERISEVVRMRGLTCPSCGKNTMEFWETEYDVPFFGRLMLTCVKCPCGYKHSDVMVLGEREPCRYVLKVEGPRDLYAKVIKSSFAKVTIPELGVEITPGPSSEGFVTNVEGILERVEEVCAALEGEAKENFLNKLREAREGRLPFTLVVEDRTGNSAIIHEKAVKEVLPSPEDEGNEDRQIEQDNEGVEGEKFGELSG